MNQTTTLTSTKETAAQTRRTAPDPRRDAHGAPIVLWDWDEQVTQNREPRALPIQRHQPEQALGLGVNAPHVRFEHHNHLIIALRPDHMRLLGTPEGC